MNSAQFFATAAQCLRRTDVLGKEFFLIIYDENFYEHFRKTLAFIWEKEEIKEE